MPRDFDDPPRPPRGPFWTLGRLAPDARARIEEQLVDPAALHWSELNALNGVLGRSAMTADPGDLDRPPIDQPGAPPPSPDALTLVELIAAWLDDDVNETEIRRRIRQARGLPPWRGGKPAQRRHGPRVPR